MQFDTKIAVVLRDDLAVWQKTNVTAFLVSGIAATVPAVVGETYRDASGNAYLPMFVQPVLVYEADVAALRRAYQRAMSRGVVLASVTGRRRQRFTPPLVRLQVRERRSRHAAEGDVVVRHMDDGIVEAVGDRRVVRTASAL
jgi:hypothetical protein